MNSRGNANLPSRVLIWSAALLMPLGAIAAGAVTSLHPEEAYPDNAAPLASPGRYTELVKDVQQELHRQGFDAGPVNGDFGSKTQAALAQFQLSRALPASGTLDERTLAELGVERDAPASAGSSAQEQRRSPGGTCDDLVALEKEACLQQGGTIEVGGKPRSGASGRAGDK